MERFFQCGPTMYRPVGPAVGRRCTRALVPTVGLAFVAACHGPPPADPTTDAPPPAPAAESRLSAPVQLDFLPVLERVEGLVPRTLGSLADVHQAGLDPRKHYAFEAERGPFTAFAEGGLLHLRTTVSYAARAYYKPFLGPTLSAGCDKAVDRPRLVLELATPLTVTPDWHLRSRVRVVRLEPASSEPRDRCDVGVLKYDVTPKVVAAARKALTRHLGDIDRKIAAVDLRDRFAGWWGTLARPIRLSNGVWLLLAPQRVAIGDVGGSGHVLTIPVTVDARPRIVTDPVPPAVDVPALPALGRAEPGDGFHVLVDGIVDYTAASRALDGALALRTIASAGRTLIVDSVTAEPATGGRLALTVAFAGDAHGALRFVGRPVLDRERREITVPDLDYDLSTDDQLIGAYAWLRSDALRSFFREKAHLPVDPALERGRQLLLSGLNRRIGSAVVLQATVGALTLRALYATRGGLIVRAEATGAAQVAVQPPAPREPTAGVQLVGALVR